MKFMHRCFVALAAALVPAVSSAFFVSPVPVNIYEYVNDITGHYLMLSDPGEEKFVRDGNAGPGWRRTGYAFGGYSQAFGFVPGQPLCRFYAPAVNSHFYTARDFECQGLRNDPKSGWIFERSDVSVAVPFNGSCAPAQYPVYRLYNNRAQFLDTNHRHTTDPAVRDAMVAQGWADEGIAFCTDSFQTPESTIEFFLAAYNAGPVTRPPAECENPGSNQGSCLEMENLAPMANSIPRQSASNFAQPNPDYPPTLDAITGWSGVFGCVNTAQRVGNADAIARDSFIQSGCTALNLVAIHINGANRLAGDVASVNPAYQFNLVAPAPFQADRRVMPWTDALQHSLDLSFQLRVQTLRGSAAGGDAAGAAMLRFRDQTTNHEIVVAVQAYGTKLQPDSVAFDEALGAVKITTAFQAHPLVGQRVTGFYIGCPEPGCVQSLSPYHFRISRDDFASIVDMARKVDARLSPSLADYMVSNFQLRNETRLDGELGVDIFTLTLSRTTLATDLPP